MTVFKHIVELALAFFGVAIAVASVIDTDPKFGRAARVLGVCTGLFLVGVAWILWGATS